MTKEAGQLIEQHWLIPSAAGGFVMTNVNPEVECGELAIYISYEADALIAELREQIEALTAKLELCERAYEYTNGLCSVKEAKEQIKELKVLMLEADALMRDVVLAQNFTEAQIAVKAMNTFWLSNKLRAESQG